MNFSFVIDETLFDSLKTIMMKNYRTKAPRRPHQIS